MRYPGSGVVLDCIHSLSLPSFLLLTAVRHEFNNLESSVVVHELELAMNLALYVVFYVVSVSSTTKELFLGFL